MDPEQASFVFFVFFLRLERTRRRKLVDEGPQRLGCFVNVVIYKV